MATEAIPFSALPRLVLAGWSPHRDVWVQLALPSQSAAFPEAKRILSRFGMLRFGDAHEHVVFEPSTAIEHDPDLWRRCEAAVGRRLYPLGYQEHQDREAIFADEDGNIYANFDDDLCLLATSFEASLRHLAYPGTARAFHLSLRDARTEPKRWLVGEASAP